MQQVLKRDGEDDHRQEAGHRQQRAMLTPLSNTYCISAMYQHGSLLPMSCPPSMDFFFPVVRKRKVNMWAIVCIYVCACVCVCVCVCMWMIGVKLEVCVFLAYIHTRKTHIDINTVKLAPTWQLAKSIPNTYIKQPVFRSQLPKTAEELTGP